MTPGAAGYYSYFDTIDKRGYYVFEVGGWRVYVLNSNCDKIDCGTENQWFNQQLRDHPAACTLMAMHHPRYSSGLEHGSSTVPRPFWRTAYQHRVDVALAGHDHDYERFRRMDGEGVHRAKGIVSFVSGTGGKSLYHLGRKRPNSQYFQARQVRGAQADPGRRHLELELPHHGRHLARQRHERLRLTDRCPPSSRRLSTGENRRRPRAAGG